MEFRHLTESDRPAIHAAFRRAFADYQVPADFEPATLDRLMARRGADLSVSVGAFDRMEMVAVMVTAVRSFEGVLSAYDVFTGVVPSHRGQRLAGRMFDVSRERLERRGVRRFLLEVIESNAGAVKAYERAGFLTRRRFHCFEVEPAALREVGTPAGVEIAPVASPTWMAWHAWRSWPVSWQNHEDSIAATVEPTVVLRARGARTDLGYAVVVPAARDLPQLVVRPDRRRQGLGAALLAAAARRLDPGLPLRVINVDAASAPDCALYARYGRASLPTQREMVLDFGA